ncbi:MAG: MptD family putative ECF transporter S component [Paratractidigestivibacter faecalis]
MVAKAKRKESGSLSSRDLIALGVFSLLFMVVSMLVVGITSMSVVAYCGCCAIAAIPAGIVWVYMHARVRAGTSLIMALVFAVIVFVIRSGWPWRSASPSAASSPSWRGKRWVREFAGVAVGYALFETCWAAGLFVPMFAQDYTAS